MRIGEIVKKTGLSQDTLRFYERKGLIRVGRTNSEWNNYRNYDKATLNRLLWIKNAKEFGFTLNEIKGLLEKADANQAACNTVLTLVDHKLRDIDQKIANLMEMKSAIIQKRNEAQARCIHALESSNCPVFFDEKSRRGNVS